MHLVPNIKDDLVIKAGPKNSLYKYANIYNLELFGPVIHIWLDKAVQFGQFRLMCIYESEKKNCVETYAYDNLEHPWIDIPVDCLDKAIGLHVYTIEFINKITGDTFYQYFNYTIQNDNPDKPYIYMEN